MSAIYWSNLFETQMVFLKEFFKKVDSETNSVDDKKTKKFLGGKELKSSQLQTAHPLHDDYYYLVWFDNDFIYLAL